MATEDVIKAIIGDYCLGFKDDELSCVLLEQQIFRTLMTIPYRESLVLQLSYGLIGNQKHTLSEIGKQLGVTRERVRQIREQGLSRFRHPSIRRNLRPYLDFKEKE